MGSTDQTNDGRDFWAARAAAEETEADRQSVGNQSRRVQHGTPIRATATARPRASTFSRTRETQRLPRISARRSSTAGHYSGPIPVVGESRTVTATNSAFSDTFAQGSTVHIYKRPGLKRPRQDDAAESGL